MSIKIALAGNPNSGKTTLFNALTGSEQFVGNWPGVTVEKKEGRLKERKDVIITDLPGIYSLSPYSPEEKAARNYIMKENPDVILNIADGTNLERSLYLTNQLAETGIPVVTAVNMADIVRKNGGTTDIRRLSDFLGFPAVEISALKNEGTKQAVNTAVKAAEKGVGAPVFRFCKEAENAISLIEMLCSEALRKIPTRQRRWYAVKIFERDKEILSALDILPEERRKTEEIIKSAERKYGDGAQSIIINDRYGFAESAVRACQKKPERAKKSATEKIDAVVTGKYTALPVFALIMFSVYFFSVSLIEVRTTGISEAAKILLSKTGCAQWLKSLIIDGIAAGVGTVLGFIPQLTVLFAMLSFLESCGYIARVAFLLDRIFRRFGLSGKSFIPILVGTGCGVPGIMATRTIENDRDRRMTVIVTTFIPCGAKLPVIAMISSSLFKGAWWVAPSAYFAGIAAIAVSGLILKKTRLFDGEPAPFIMELPEYRMPAADTLICSVWERISSFIKKAGTVILISSVAVWAGSRFGLRPDGAFGYFADMELSCSIIGKIGAFAAPLFAPLGFGTGETGIKSAVATIMGLAAKEEIVNVFGILSIENMGRLSGYSFLIFNLLCAPCAAAVGAVRREMGSAKWTLFAVCYQCAFAYAVSLVIYQTGRLFSGQGTAAGVFFALAAVFTALCLILRPNKSMQSGLKIKSLRI